MELKQYPSTPQEAFQSTFNCTLWNWNSIIRLKHYRIRTFNCTLWNWNINRRSVLRRIKFSFNCTLWNWNFSGRTADSRGIRLLIVPYGIETSVFFPLPLYDCPFNCTLWNWNTLTQQAIQQAESLLIVPYGIETIKEFKFYNLFHFF